MRRLYDEVIKQHLAKYRQMLFLSGPRQVGKTTAGLGAYVQPRDVFYFNWDNSDDRIPILDGPGRVAKSIGIEEVREELPILIFDELHKYPGWKGFLKGFFDTYGNQLQMIVTGSARMDTYRKGGDSMMGRYFLYRLHPISIRELVDPEPRFTEVAPPKRVNDELFDRLYRFGGFPEPFVRGEIDFYNRWKILRHHQLLQEDVRDLTQIQQIAQLEVLLELLRFQAGQLMSYSSLAKKVRISVDTVRRWLETLKATYYCFAIAPWSKNISRSLIKEPKLYLCDWSLVEDEGARCENFVACHLLKAVQFWTDYGLGDYGLYFLRDKEKREVDFLITKDGKPWTLIEVKKGNNKAVSPDLHYFQKHTGAPHAFQAVLDMPYVDRNCFELSHPMIVPIRTLLSQLV